MGKKDAKDTLGNQYRFHSEFAEEVLAKNAKQPAQNSPKEDAKQ